MSLLLDSVAAKSVRDRAPLAMSVGVGLTLGALAMIAAASGLQDQMADIFTDLPDGVSNIIGGGEGNYVIGELFSLIVPIAVLVVAISGGVNAYARGENRRTADLLLTQPVTRRHVVVSNAVVLVGNLVVVCVFVGAGAALGATLFDIDGFSAGDAVAATTHVFFLGFAFGMITLAVANVTGSATLGTAVAAGAALVSNLAAGLLPLVDNIAGAERASPWYYYNGSNPLVNGVDLAHIGILTATGAISLAVAVLVVEARDVGSYRSGRVLRVPALGRINRPSVSTVFAKALTERLTLIVLSGGGLAAMAVGVSLLYGGLESTLADFADSLPSSLDGLIGSSDLGTPVGWIQAEMMATTAPIVFIAVGIVIGVNAIAGEASRQTLRLLVSAPITRSRVVLEHSAALVIAVTIVAVLCFGGLTLGSAVGDLGLDLGNIAGATAHVAMLGLLFGAIGLAVGAGASHSAAIRITSIAAVASYLANWLLGISETTDQWAPISPWYYSSDSEALANGADFVHLAVLALLTVAAVAFATRVFERREDQRLSRPANDSPQAPR